VHAAAAATTEHRPSTQRSYSVTSPLGMPVTAVRIVTSPSCGLLYLRHCAVLSSQRDHYRTLLQLRLLMAAMLITASRNELSIFKRILIIDVFSFPYTRRLSSHLRPAPLIHLRRKARKHLHCTVVAVIRLQRQRHSRRACRIIHAIRRCYVKLACLSSSIHPVSGQDARRYWTSTRNYRI